VIQTPTLRESVARARRRGDARQLAGPPAIIVIIGFFAVIGHPTPGLAVVLARMAVWRAGRPCLRHLGSFSGAHPVTWSKGARARRPKGGRRAPGAARRWLVRPARQPRLPPLRSIRVPA
jgi:hypothetical protein